MIRHIALLLLITVPSQAGELQRAARDVKSLATAPLHWRSAEWRRFGEGVAAVGVVMLADKTLTNAAERNRSQATDHFSRVITPWGGGRALQVSALMFAGGALFHRDRVEGAGRDSLESELWAAGVVTPLLKDLFGRSRPNSFEGTWKFHPGRTDNPHNSFPSGHATNAFAAATAIAAHYDNWLVPALVYGVASGVAFSRVNDHVHFPSDVVAGALIGRAVAKGIVFGHTRVRVYVAPPLRRRSG